MYSRARQISWALELRMSPCLFAGPLPFPVRQESPFVHTEMWVKSVENIAFCPLPFICQNPCHYLLPFPFSDSVSQAHCSTPAMIRVSSSCWPLPCPTLSEKSGVGLCSSQDWSRNVVLRALLHKVDVRGDMTFWGRIWLHMWPPHSSPTVTPGHWSLPTIRNQPYARVRYLSIWPKHQESVNVSKINEQKHPMHLDIGSYHHPRKLSRAPLQKGRSWYYPTSLQFLLVCYLCV